MKCEQGWCFSATEHCLTKDTEQMDQKHFNEMKLHKIKGP